MNSSNHEFEDTSECSDILSLSLKIENTSSYGGIYSNLNDDQSLTDYSANISSQKNSKIKKNDTQPVTFQWDKKENEVVYLTGSFCNWKQFFIMPKYNNLYSLTLPLPKALHKFKFRINDNFVVSGNYPVMKDGDNNCNYIDTTETTTTSKNKSKSKSKSKSKKGMKKKEETDEETNNNISNSSDSSSSSFNEELEDDEAIYLKKRKKRIKKMKKQKYCQIYPKKANLNNYAPDIPYSYNYMYNIDVISSQKLIGKTKYYEPKENNILGDNCSYKKIGVLPAVEINHIHSNSSIISGHSVLCSSFMRYRNKFITFLYYKPI